MDVRIVAPRELWPPYDVVDLAHGLAAGGRTRGALTDDVELGVGGVDFAYTNVWVSMGESIQQRAPRVPMLLPYRATEHVMQATGRPGSKFMHCMPSEHNASTDLGRRVRDSFQLDGAEVTAEVFESPASIVFDQAKNRPHAINAVMTRAFGT